MIDIFQVEGVELVTYEIEWDVSARSILRTNWRRAIFLDRNTDPETRKRLYKALLELEWLAPKVRYAVTNELGLSRQQQKRDYEAGATAMIRHDISQHEAHLRQKGERPRGGIHSAAVAEIAERLGMKVETLQKRLQRDARQNAARSKRNR
jgi:hypothetical protein